MSAYYCLIAGLPDIHIDDQKLAYSVAAFKEECYGQLSEKDKQLFDLFFYKYDNSNLLRFLANRDAELDANGTLTSDELEAIVKEIKEDGAARSCALPYLNTFVPAYLEDKPLSEGTLWQDQLSTLYYAHGIASRNEFVAAWFELNLNINNLLIAFSARQHGFEAAPYIVGENSVATALRSTSSRDFGLSGTLDYFEAVQRISEESNLYERERKIDQLRWTWLEDNTFFHYFSFERIFAYLLKLEIVERWHEMNREAGEKMFREVLATLKSEVVVPEEFNENI